MARDLTLLAADAASEDAPRLRHLLAGLAPLHAGRVVEVAQPAAGAADPDAVDPHATVVEFVSLDGAIDAAAALLRAVEDDRLEGVRALVCNRATLDADPGAEATSDGTVGTLLAMLAGTPPGTVLLTAEAAAGLASSPLLTVRSLELLEEAAGPVPVTLDEVSRRREVRLGGIRFAGRRRRPSGERAPLPRELRVSGRLAVLAAVLVVVVWATLFVFPDTVGWWQARDDALLQRLLALRNDVVVEVATLVSALGSVWVWRPLRIGTLVVLAGLRRWRHLLVALLALFVLETLVSGMATAIGRPRPLVPIVGSWEGYAHPSAPVANLTVTLTILGLSLLPRRPWRRWLVIGGSVVVAAVILARLVLGLEHLTDGVVAALLGVAVPVVLFRMLAPEQVFPVGWRHRGRGAHLDIDARRAAAIRTAMRDQLGLEVVGIEPFGLEASGGSTPLRLTVAGEGERWLFAKLYSTGHLRADRWYKAARTILYGSLEDELRHPSVRRLVEREDYLLLTMRKAGIACARPYGVVEITPEREYLTVTEFIDGAEEISKVEVDDQLIDEGLTMIRRLWDAGLAHRDIKPGNVLVQRGHVRLVDVAFAMVRPTPWRQAVDLANMMIILALRTSPEQVYARALRIFAPEDIAEAFAATRSVTIPSESRSSLRLLARTEGLDLVERFRDLAPPREPISIQRWSRRRIVLTLGALALVLVLLPILVQNLTGAGFL